MSTFEVLVDILPLVSFSVLIWLQIFETIYFAALEASCELAKSAGPYETYAGSPVSNFHGAAFRVNLRLTLICVSRRQAKVSFNTIFGA
jgi:hypothetical protein